jgi:hypothetical protein
MNISSEEIAAYPGALTAADIVRERQFTAVEVLWESKESPRVRSARSDDLRLTKSRAEEEVASVKKWWAVNKDKWDNGSVVLVVHDGQLTDDEIEVWMDLNLVVPFFRERLGNENLSLAEIQMSTMWHKWGLS